MRCVYSALYHLAPLSLMQRKFTNRQSLFAAIIAFYLIPLLFFSGYSIRLMSHNKSWALLSMGLFLVSLGALSLIYLLFYWEQSLKGCRQENDFPDEGGALPSLYLERENKVTAIDPALMQVPKPPHPFEEARVEDAKGNAHPELHQALSEKVEQLEKALRDSEETLRKNELEKEQLAVEALKRQQELSDYKLFSEEQLRQKQMQLTAAQQALENQQSEMEKRQEQISHLDAKVHDLSYEIKTLLHLSEEEKSAAPLPLDSVKEDFRFLSEIYGKENIGKTDVNGSDEPFAPDHSHIIQTAQEASRLLQRCIDTAQKLTGTNYFGSETSRYRDFSTSYFAIDQRRLWDSLRSETGALLVVYSQKEQKLCFANQGTKALLGWAPERFISDFSLIIQGGINEWKKGLAATSTMSDVQIRLLAKTRQGQEVWLNGHLGAIPSGLFRGHVIALFYPTTSLVAHSHA